jgi:hypothetical protein
MKGVCDCVDKVDEKLKAEGTNTRLAFMFVTVRRKGKLGEMVTLPSIETALIEKRRGARPKRVIPTYCPFCGEKYDLGTEETSVKKKGA